MGKLQHKFEYMSRFAADGKADATLETLETDRKIKELKRLTEVLARFAEKQEKRRLHLDVSEGRLRILIQNNTQRKLIVCPTNSSYGCY